MGWYCHFANCTPIKYTTSNHLILFSQQQLLYCISFEKVPSNIYVFCQVIAMSEIQTTIPRTVQAK